MRKQVVSLILFVCALCPNAHVAQADTGMGQDEIWELVRDAYVYTFPLMMMDATATVFTNSVEPTSNRAPMNQFIHAKNLATAAMKTVVTPNVDTIYTQAFIDLEDTALVFHKPAADRYFSVEILDAYTNCVVILGTGGDTQDEMTYLFTGPDFDGTVSDAYEQVSMPTNTGWLLARIVVEDEADKVNVYALQEQMDLIPLDIYESGNEYTAPLGTKVAAHEYVPVEHVASLSPEAYFAKANQLMALHRPPDEDADILRRMEAIGVGPGQAFDMSLLGEDVLDQWTDMLAGLRDYLAEQSKDFYVNMGVWAYFGSPIAEFGTEYAYRAHIALVGLGANPVSVAIYPSAKTTDDGERLDGHSKYTIHFEKDSLPPTEEYGFWSITAYTQDDFLIDNAIDRYLINDRSGFTFNEDGSLDILLQVNPPEDESMHANWLPVSEEAFHLVMRIYLPDESIISGEWTAPSIEAQR